MLDPAFTVTLAQSIVDMVLKPAICSTDDVIHIHVLQDTLQKIRDPRYHRHPEFTTGYAYGQTYYGHHAPASSFALEEVITVLRDNLARQDHQDLNTFYGLMGCQSIDYAYRVGYVLGWLTTVIDHGMTPVYPAITSVA